MEKTEMREQVLRMFQKEKQIWRLMAMDGNKTAKGQLERVEEAERLFREECE